MLCISGGVGGTIRLRGSLTLLKAGVSVVVKPAPVAKLTGAEEHRQQAPPLFPIS